MIVERARDGQASGSALIIWVLQLSLAVVASFSAFAMKPMGVGSCAPDCDDALLQTSIWGFIGFAMTLVALLVFNGVGDLALRAAAAG